LIDNSATAKRLRCGLPRFGLRISPLALQCTQPRTLSLLPQLRASSRRGASTPGCRGRAPQYCQLSMRVRNTDRRKGHAAGRSLVIPRSNIPPLNQPLGTRCFVHGNTHGRFPETGRPEPTTDFLSCTQAFHAVAASRPQNQGGLRWKIVSVFRRGSGERRRPPSRERVGRHPHRCAPQSTTSFLTAAVLVYTAAAGITAAAGSRVALELILAASFG